MKTNEIWYSRKFNLGNYESEEIGILVVVEEGEKFTDVLNAARKAVLSQGASQTKTKSGAVRELQAVLERKTSGDAST